MADDIARSPTQLGHLLRAARRRRDWNQTDLGARAGLRQGTVSNVEGGDGAAKLATLFNLLAALDLELVVRTRSRASDADIEDLF